MQLEYKKHQRNVQKIRDSAIPRNPTNCAGIRDAFQQDDIMATLGRSKHLDHPIFFDGVVEKRKHSFCVFSSKYAIALIEKHVEAGRRHFMLDATFKVCPVGPFTQLLIIHAAYIKLVSVSVQLALAINSVFFLQVLMRFHFSYIFIGIPVHFRVNVQQIRRCL